MYSFCTLFDDILRLLTPCHGMSRCLMLSTVYVRHLAVSVHNFVVSATQMCQFATAYEKDVDRSIFHSSLLTFPKFHLLRCSSIDPCHGKSEGKAIKRSRKEADMKTKSTISYLLRAWKRERNKKKKSQRSRYKDEIPDFLFRTCMSKIRNTENMSLYISLNWYIMHNTRK